MDNVVSNQNKFNVYVFLSTFARNLIEVFIPLILFKFGYSLKETLFYYLLSNIFSVIICYPFIVVAKKYNNKVLAIIGILAFVLIQFLLNNMVDSIFYLVLLALLYAIYRRGYWISRRFYNMKIMTTKNISKTYSVISVVNQIGVICSAYIGSLILDFVGIKTLTCISISLFLLSIVPLFFLKFQYPKNNTKLSLMKTLKKIPLSNIFLLGTYEVTTVVKLFFSLYIFIYVKNTYQTIGGLNLVTGLSVCIFTYLYGKKINGKKNFLRLSILLTVGLYFLKANVTSYFLVVICFLEGIVNKMHEISISKESYALSNKFEYNNYNLAYEMIQNVFRTVIVLVLLIFVDDLKLMIYITLGIMALGILMNFKKTNLRNYKVK